MFEEKDVQARVVPYEEYNKNEIIKCPVCPWVGLPKDALREDYDEESTINFDLSCPRCEKMIIVVPYSVTKNN
ncbi:MAG: hypothetical protein ACWGHO_04570 [Candidatus Moraniibacteriota bacterium]